MTAFFVCLTKSILLTLRRLKGIIITNSDGDTVARYSYDAWCVLTVTQDVSGCGIAQINPYRYRGYYFDSEIVLLTI